MRKDSMRILNSTVVSFPAPRCWRSKLGKRLSFVSTAFAVLCKTASLRLDISGPCVRHLPAADLSESTALCRKSSAVLR